MNFVKASLKNRQVTIPILAIVFVFGINSLISMPRREDPRITIPGGLVIAYFPGADAVTVEDQVTRKLEEYLFQFEEVHKQKTYTITSDGMVVVHLWLTDKVRQPDIFWSKLRHQLSLVKAVDLPQGVIGPVVNSDFGDTESMIIGITSENAGYRQLKDYTVKLEDQLRTISAISKLKRIGEQQEQVEVTFNSRKMAWYDISLQQVAKVLQSQNTISPTGELNADDMRAPVHSADLFKSENDIKKQIVGVSRTGAVVRLNEIADVEKAFEESSGKITVNGKSAVLLAVQMYEGKNIVRSGKEIDRLLEEFSQQLPENIKLTTIVNQPRVVDKNISRFLREFMLAIIAVVVVVFLLLPFSIAAVSATAIPMAISITFALLHLLGLELHQVSLASLIMVLGLVVDDAIIIADNYVELLDRGNDRWTAAWRSATDLVVPVLTATITIIGSFLPIVILTGTVGEFIRALPITVTIALASSFLVAMFLTPLLCYIFIKKGLHPGQGASDRKTALILDKMQVSYNNTIEWCLKNSRLTIAASLSTILLAGLLFSTAIRRKFFPEAERDQFIIELWMPTGTSLAKTEQAILRIENLVRNDQRVFSYATFIGRSAPRFYYNYSPEMPAVNYAQILINTSGNKATASLFTVLKDTLNIIVPEGMPHVRLLKQGQPEAAPVEIRISGPDIDQLKKTGNDIKDILRRSGGSSMIRSDFREDHYGLRIRIKKEAIRLGFMEPTVAQAVYTGSSGYKVSTYFEGNNPVDIVFRLNEENRRNAGDLENIYIPSPVTGAAIPLRQIADINPEWQQGRIIRRNGVRTLTIQSETADGVLPSELLKLIRPELSKLKPPPGYKISFGGERANQDETLMPLFSALAVSLIIIFIVLLFQFRNLKEAGLVMLSIPLSWLGAVSGLLVTGNEFGFTAFTGMIALSGIVVRNAIILIDHTNELLRKGMDISTAASQAGKRRLRPIFLTAMAAAFGVLPMILSGSSLWSPSASVIAFGVVWSMIISTISIPVFYIAVIRPGDKMISEKSGYDETGK